MELNIWDCAGDTIIHNLGHLFLKDCRVVVLVYAIDNRKSFDQLIEWYEYVEDKSEEIFTVIVGTKSDLALSRAVPAFYA